MSSQYGELWPLTADIVSLVWGTSANFNGFRVLAALLNSSGRQPNCGVEQRAPPIFGRATITLGIGPHSSYHELCHEFCPQVKRVWTTVHIKIARVKNQSRSIIMLPTVGITLPSTILMKKLKEKIILQQSASIVWLFVQLMANATTVPVCLTSLFLACFFHIFFDAVTSGHYYISHES